MNILYVVQGYGPDAVGGAELHCRLMATKMAERGHNVSVLTTCASSYRDWANTYEPGVSTLDGVRVHRMAVDHPRRIDEFSLASQRVLTGYKPEPLLLQEYWIDAQGPHLPEFESWLDAHAGEFDVVIFFTYLYFPTVRGVPIAARHTTTVLHPLAHDEPMLALPVFRPVLSKPHGLVFNIEEEAELVHAMFRPTSPTLILGIGTDLDVATDGGAAFRSTFDIGDAPYVVCVGRVDANKGSDELFDQFVVYKERHPSSLKLVFVGPVDEGWRRHDDVVVTGFVDAAMRDSAVGGALVSLHPSYFESFSMALVEAWALGKPTIVNGRCDVFRGQVTRSGGGIAYEGYAEFEAAMELLLEDHLLAKRCAQSGRAFVETHFSWPPLLQRYEDFLESLVQR